MKQLSTGARASDAANCHNTLTFLLKTHSTSNDTLTVANVQLLTYGRTTRTSPNLLTSGSLIWSDRYSTVAGLCRAPRPLEWTTSPLKTWRAADTRRQNRPFFRRLTLTPRGRPELVIRIPLAILPGGGGEGARDDSC